MIALKSVSMVARVVANSVIEVEKRHLSEQCCFTVQEDGIDFDPGT